MAIVMIALGALMAIYFTSGARLGRAIECEVAEWTAIWSGQNVVNCDPSGGGPGGPGGGGSGGAPGHSDLPSLPEVLDGSQEPPQDVGNPEDPEDVQDGLPPVEELDEEDEEEEEHDDELCEESTVWGAIRQVWDGFINDGLWEDVKGLWELVKDVVKFAWGGAAREEVAEKYSAVLGAILENPEQVLYAMFEKPIEDWQNGCYVAAISNGVYMLLSLVAPGDELAKIVRVLPDDLARVITKISKMTPEEVARLLDRVEDLTPEELAALYRRLDEMTPEELAEAGITADKLDELGFSDEAIDNIVSKIPCSIVSVPSRKPPGLAKVATAPLAKPCKVTYQPLGGFTGDVLTKGFHVNSDIGELSLIPRRLSDGTVEITVKAAGTKTGTINKKVVEGVKKLLKDDPQGAIKRAKAIISNFEGDPTYATRVEEARLLLEAFEDGRYVVSK